MPRLKKVVISEEQRKKMAEVDYGKLQEKIIENLIELQKVHTNMAEKFDKLSEQMINLLTLFEMAARSFADHPANQGTEKDKEFLEKIDRLLDQNKTIARGLTLMEERIRERVYGAPEPFGGQAPNNPEPKAEYMSSAMNKPGTEAHIDRPLPKF